MKHSTISFFALSLVLLLAFVGCSAPSITTYDEGITQMQDIQSRYQVDFVQTPVPEAIDSFRLDLEALQRKIADNDDTTAITQLLDYRLTLLESDVLLSEGFKWGPASTTEAGFGCKGYERIMNSSTLRNQSATLGFEAVGLLESFIAENPEHAAALSLGNRQLLELRTTYSVVSEQAEKDKRVINSICKKEGSLEEGDLIGTVVGSD